MGFVPGAEEFDADIYGVLTVGTENAGNFRCIAATNKDKWAWNGSAFPAAGFVFKMTAYTGAINPTQTYRDYPFSTKKSVPQKEWPGNSRTYTIKKNGSLIGWLEVENGSNPGLMWWSNGSSLVNNHITMSIGDGLAFDPASLPSTPQYPLKNVQTKIAAED